MIRVNKQLLTHLAALNATDLDLGRFLAALPMAASQNDVVSNAIKRDHRIAIFFLFAWVKRIQGT